jgi:hypothetical protein
MTEPKFEKTVAKDGTETVRLVRPKPDKEENKKAPEGDNVKKQ